MWGNARCPGLTPGASAQGPEYACPEVEVVTEVRLQRCLTQASVSALLKRARCLNSQSGPMHVRVYALAEPGLQLPGIAWDYAAWREAHLAAFVRMCADFRRQEFPEVA